jgi:hypothetical protein
MEKYPWRPGELMLRQTYGKMFSQSGSRFPWTRDASAGRSGQGMRELEADQMIAVGMCDSQSPGTKISRRLG